jgi:hypothetical protein
MCPCPTFRGVDVVRVQDGVLTDRDRAATEKPLSPAAQ